MSSPLLDLPTELLLKVARHLPLRDLSRLLLTNRLCNDLLTSLLYENPICDDGGHLPVIFWATMLGNTSLVASILDRGGGGDGSDINQYAHPDPGKHLPDCPDPDAHRRMGFYRSWLLAKSAMTRHPCQNLLQWAVCCHRLDIVELLLRRGASVNAEPHRGCTAPRGRRPPGTALHYAVEPSKVVAGFPPEEIVGALLEHGADWRVGNGEGDSALQLHLKLRPSDIIVRRMLDNGVDVNAVGNDGLTPLWTAISGPGRYFEAVVSLLVERGADTEVKLFGESLMHHVILRLGPGTEHSWWPALRFFLQRAQDVNVRDSCNQTLLHYAVSRTHVYSHVVKLLVEKGVDHRLKDIFGRTALDLAVSAGGKEHVAAILRGLDDPVQAIEPLDSNMQGLRVTGGDDTVESNSS